MFVKFLRTKKYVVFGILVCGQKKSESNFDSLERKNEGKRKHNTAARFQGSVAEGFIGKLIPTFSDRFTIPPSHINP